MGLCRDLLQRLDDTGTEMLRLQDKYDRQWMACLGLGCKDSDGIRSGGSGGPKDGALAALADTSDALNEAKRQHLEAFTAVKSLLYQLSADADHGGRDALIIDFRYLRGMKWKLILWHLQDEGYKITTLRTLYLWHDAALCHGDRLLEEANET